VRFPFHRTVRARLALLLAVLVVLTGVVLLAASYLVAVTTVRTSVSGPATCPAGIGSGWRSRERW
jgi:hypothetical protein